MIFLSLFDGMSCGRITLKKMGVEPTKYYASEVDKFAIAESKANFPNTIHLGDVANWREWDIDWSSIDWLIGGSPCQGFSAAGKQGGTTAIVNGEKVVVTDRETYLNLKERSATEDIEFLSHSYLFWEYVLCLDHVKANNPDVKFMLENVKMSAKNLNMITEALGVTPVFINSALVCAQNRQRYYWCNFEVTQPEDRGILLKDIIEQTPTNPTVMTDRFVNRQAGRKCLVDNFEVKASNLSAMEYVKNGRQGDYVNCDGIEFVDRDKSYALTASYCNGVDKKQYFEGKHKQLVFIEQPAPSFDEWFKSTKDCGGTKEEYDRLYLPLKISPAAMVGRKINPKTGKREDSNKEIKTIQYLEVQGHDKLRCLSTAAKDTLVSDLPKGRYVAKEARYRKLTVVECCRLQGVEDDYFKVSSNTQAYKMLGNGWQCDTIEHIFKCGGIDAA